MQRTCLTFITVAFAFSAYGSDTLVRVVSPEIRTYTAVVIEPQSLGPSGKAPMAITGMNVRYPPELREKRIVGWVIAEFAVDTKGNVQDPKIVFSDDPGLGAEVLGNVRRCSFVPAEIGGVAASVRMRVLVTFALPNDSFTQSAKT
jgi:TonB family protein